MKKQKLIKSKSVSLRAIYVGGPKLTIMKLAISRRNKVLITVFSVTLFGYISSYFATTEIFQGKFEDDLIDLRLFESPDHMAVFRPLISLEEHLRSNSEIEFYGHIKNGASLPPARFTDDLTISESK